MKSWPKEGMKVVASVLIWYGLFHICSHWPFTDLLMLSPTAGCFLDGASELCLPSLIPFHVLLLHWL